MICLYSFTRFTCLASLRSFLSNFYKYLICLSSSCYILQFILSNTIHIPISNQFKTGSFRASAFRIQMATLKVVLYENIHTHTPINTHRNKYIFIIYCIATYTSLNLCTFTSREERKRLACTDVCLEWGICEIVVSASDTCSTSLSKVLWLVVCWRGCWDYWDYTFETLLLAQAKIRCFVNRI